MIVVTICMDIVVSVEMLETLIKVAMKLHNVTIHHCPEELSTP